MDRDSSGIRPTRTFWNRRYLVDRRFQMKYTLMVVLASSVLFGLFGYQLYKGELARTEILKIQNLDVQGLVQSQDSHVLWYLAGFFVLQVASLVVLGILITHRIAGPMFRVHQYLEELAKGGEVKPLDKIRSRDEFHEFFESLSDLIDRFRARSAEQRAKVAEIRAALEGPLNDPAKLKRCRDLCGELLEIL
jgi:methyl-accepting chemotaxis protein